MNKVTTETRVYVIDCDKSDSFRDWEYAGQFEKIKEEAERQGNVYSLQGFQDAVNDEELILDNSFIYIGDNLQEGR